MSSKVCLGGKLKRAKTVRCIPLKYDWVSYSKAERKAILEAQKIYFPTIHYAPVFASIGKEIFPSLSSYQLLGNKIRQTLAFQAAGMPMPETRIFTGSKRQERIEAVFPYPFVAKIPIASSCGKGVFLIKNGVELERYLAKTPVAYIQEYIPLDKDIRVVVIGREAVVAYWKLGQPGTITTNVSKGGVIDFEDVPAQAIDLALEAARRCRIDHAGFDLCMSSGRGPLILEANVHFGREGFAKAGVSYRAMLSRMVDSGKI